MEEIPVYLFTGFMDSGKTSLIHETLFGQGFGEGAKTLIISCEDGDVAYDEEKLKSINAQLYMVEKEEDFTEELLKQVNLQYLPDQVFIEYNGTWEIAKMLELQLPTDWVIVQSLATVDATTYDMYLTNMRSMILDQLCQADVVIFNRCDETTQKGKFRASIKALNRRAQIVYEKEDGSIDESEEELPFDLDQELIELSDADYGLWYLDAMDNPKKYDGKKVKFLAYVFNPDRNKGKGMFVPGRFAMTCCADDTQFVGFKCKYKSAAEIPHKSWITLTAEVKVEFAKEYKGKGPVLYPIEIQNAQKPEDELVYFS